MLLFRRVCCFLMLLSVSFHSYSQLSAPYPQTFLWRISGNGLQKPSYLFGTMHLKDKRLFLFTDSVYQALKNNEGMAMEVSPDELMAYSINHELDPKANDDKLDKILSAEDIKKYSKQLSKRFNKPVDKITIREVVAEKNKWLTQAFEKGEMSTFVDAYLYDLARRQGKWVGGVEDMSDQAGLMESMIDKRDLDFLLAGEAASAEANASLEKMIRIYETQDLSAVENMSNTTSAEQKDVVLTRRNIKMSRRMDSLMQFRTMFFAVGAAHLPGDSGVINLLAKRGFRVEPVFSAKKIASADYKPEVVDIPWVTINDKRGFYTVAMPGNPTDVKLYGMLEMKFFYDIFNSAGFITTAISTPVPTSGMDSALSAVARNMFSEADIKKGKAIAVNGLPGKEYISTGEGEKTRLQLFAGKNVVYMVAVTSMAKNNLLSEDANRFFRSFEAKTPAFSTSGNESVFTDSIMGITLNTPVKLEYNDQFSKKDEAWTVNGYAGSHMETGAYIILFSKEVNAGYTIDSDSTIYAEMYTTLSAQYDSLKQTDTIIDNVSVVEYYGLNRAAPSLCLHAFNTVRNNRNILLLAVADTSQWHNNASVSNTFSSFHFIEHPPVNWSQQSSAYNGFSTWAPASYRTYVSAPEDSGKLIAYDTTTSTSYIAEADTLDKYTWYASDSAFWSSVIKSYSRRGILVSATPATNGDLPAMDIIIKMTAAGRTHKRVRVVLNNNITYSLIASGEKDYLCSGNTDKFFTGFKVAHPAAPGFVSTSKALLLLKDIQSEDEDIRSKAANSLDDAAFTKDDLPILQDALYGSYRSSYDSSVDNQTNYNIAEVLQVLGDTATIAFVKNTYASLNNEKAYIRPVALTLLAGMHNSQSYDALSSILKVTGPLPETSYMLGRALRDSLALTTTIYKSLLMMAGDTNFVCTLADVCLNLIDSGHITIQQLAGAEKDFIRSARLLLPGLKRKDDYSFETTYLIDLLGLFNTTASVNILKEYLKVADKQLKMHTAVRLVKIKQPVPADVFVNIASDKEVRNDLYDELKGIKKTGLFPKQYFTQRSHAESNIYAIASDDDTVEKMTFISRKEALYKGKKYIFYLYKLTYGTDDESSSYLGIAGGYHLNGITFEPLKDLSGVFSEEEFDPLKTDTFFKQYLKGMTDWDTDPPPAAGK